MSAADTSSELAELCERRRLDSVFVFDPVDVFDKWGFGDGDMLEGVTNACCELRGWLDADGEQLYASYPYVHHKWLLWAAWQRFVAPTVELDVPVGYAVTLHNPVRAEGSGEEEGPPVGFDPDPVEVAAVDLVDLALEVFPKRGPGWLQLFRALYNGPRLADYPGALAVCESAAALDDWRLLVVAEHVLGGVEADVAISVAAAL